MNPSVYKRRARAKRPTAMQELGGWGKAIVQAPIHGAVAFAFILFAASAVGGMTLVAQAEIGNGDFSSPVAMHKLQGAVLGEHTNRQNMPNMEFPQMGSASTVPQTISFSVTATPDTTGTSTRDIIYNVQYSFGNATSVSVGVAGRVQAKNLPGSGTVKVKVRPGLNEVTFASGNGKGSPARLLTFYIFGMPKPKMSDQDQGQQQQGGECEHGMCGPNASSTPTGQFKPQGFTGGGHDNNINPPPTPPTQ